MKILLKNATIVTMNKEKTVYNNGDILVVNSKITAVGKVEETNADEILNCTGKIIMPGLVNTHVHTSQQLARGLADDVSLLVWLRDRIWPYESNLTAEDSYVSTLLCCLEQIKSGVTSFCEAGGQHVAGMAKAVEQAGIRAKLTKSVMDCGEGLPAVWQKTTQEEIDSQLELFNKLNNTAEGRINVWFGLRTIFNTTEKLILQTKELADNLKTGITMHVAEGKVEVDYCKELHGVGTVTHLRDLGVLDKNLLAVHTVWLEDEEVLMFRDHNVKASHNPASAMRVLGFAKVPRMLREGVCVSIGTEGAPTNNRMNMVDEMWVTSLIHKGWRLEPDVVKAQEILQMATVNGAKSLLDENLYGSLEVGKDADLIIINPNSVDMLPMHDSIANLVTSMHSTNIESTMCRGKWIMKNRVVLTLNEEDILKEAKERALNITKRAGIILPDRFPAITL